MAYTNLKNLFTEIADAIRSKRGMSTNKIQAKNFPKAIDSIPIYNDTSDATLSSENQVLKGKTAYGPNGKITGTGSAAKTQAYVNKTTGNDTAYGFSVISFDGTTLILSSSNVAYGGTITIKLS